MGSSQTADPSCFTRPGYQGCLYSLSLIQRTLPISLFARLLFYLILYSENQCISKLDKIGILIDMKFH